jgi:hypothetical protein
VAELASIGRRDWTRTDGRGLRHGEDCDERLERDRVIATLKK